MNKETFIRSDLKTRGWTDSLIRKFLPTPDGTRPNPKFSNAGAPMRLYLRSRVANIEASPGFQNELAEAAKRKEAAKKGVETKSKRIRNYLDTLEIEVPVMDKKVLIEAAIRNACSLGLPDYVELSVERMCVNYLRHCLTRYEYELSKIVGQVGARDAYFEIKEMVLDNIGLKYEWLAEECQQQKEKAWRKQSESL